MHFVKLQSTISSQAIKIFANKLGCSIVKCRVENKHKFCLFCICCMEASSSELLIGGSCYVSGFKFRNYMDKYKRL